jgi:thiamine biosynthesis lipoprotein
MASCPQREARASLPLELESRDALSMNAMKRNPSLVFENDRYAGRFMAMASPCEVLLEHDNFIEAARQVEAVAAEAWRIETKFSRYRDDNIIYRINTSGGKTITVDEETAHLLDMASQLFDVSEGRFDITSGVLRRVWKFDGSDKVPDQASIDALLPHIGWQKVVWKNPCITLPEGMELDFGGIGKEYAVDRAFNLLAGMTDAAMLVNFGGDLHARGPCRNGKGWQVGIESPHKEKQLAGVIQLVNGAIATSGDSRHFLLKDGVHYSHILNPRTGWPVLGGPRSATLCAPDCTSAGMLATRALLAGADAETFLKQQKDIRYWLVW